MANPVKDRAPAAPESNASKRIRDLKELPSYRAVLSGEKGKFPLSPLLRSTLAVLETANNRCIMAASDGGIGSHAYFDLQQKLSAAGYVIESTLIVDAGVLRACYELEAPGDKPKASSATVEIQESKVEREIDRLIEDLMERGVSDLHIEVRAQGANVRIREAGVLSKYANWPISFARELVNTMYNALADANSAEIAFNDRYPMRASITRMTRFGQTKLRFQSVPAYPEGAFDVVIRLQALSGAEKHVELGALGYTESHLYQLETMMRSPSGAIILAGTTGSGKSTTIKNMLQRVSILRPGSKIYSVEDPPEFYMPYVSQIPVPPPMKGDTSNPFMECLKATMRADPDILMVGEIRDLPTASVAAQMVLTGHLMYSTVHADGAIGVVKRLEDLGLDVRTLAYPKFFAGLIYQTLVPKLCQHCKVRFDPNASKEDSHIFGRFKLVDPTIVERELYVQGPGCDKCSKTLPGISGRSACAEMVIPDVEMRKFFRDSDYEGATNYWKGTVPQNVPEEDMTGRTAVEHAILKVKHGIVSPYHLEDCFGMVTVAMNLQGYDAVTMIEGRK